MRLTRLRALPDPDATARLAHDLARVLRAGDLLALHGDLGAGKTTLTRHLAQTLGADPLLVSSPTFVIVNVYPLPTPTPTPTAHPHAHAHAPRQLVHADAYRLTGPDDLDALGWDRLTDPGSGSLVVVEWGERIAGALPDARTAHLTLTPTAERARDARLDAPASWAERPGFERFDAPPPTSPPTSPAARTPTRCPITGRPVPADAPTWPFADEKARMADLYRWMTGSYQVSRPLEHRDLEEGVD